MVMGAQRARTLSLPPSASAAASPATAGPAAAGPTQACADRLDQLEPALAARGMTASLVTPAGRVPSLRVVNPAAPALAEDVYAGCCADGSWWFWWSWAERIAAASDLDQAAARIAHVLAAADDD
jgi:hypothetical protein